MDNQDLPNFTDNIAKRNGTIDCRDMRPHFIPSLTADLSQMFILSCPGAAGRKEQGGEGGREPWPGELRAL